MIKYFLREVIVYLVKIWGSLLLIMSPVFLFSWLFDNFDFGIITRFNMFLLCIAGVFGVIVLMGHVQISSKEIKEPKMKLNRAQWDTALGVISWFQSHELGALMLILLGFFIVCMPVFWIWAQLYLIGALNSYLSAFGFLVLLILPFFLFPAILISSIHESVIHPEKPSLNQIYRIISTLYSGEEVTGETLEIAKKRFISLPSKRSKIVGTGLLVVLASMLVLLELIELGYVSETYMQYTFYVYLAIFVFTIAMLMIRGKKKSELDEWIGSSNGEGAPEKNSTSNIKNIKFDNFRSNSRLKLAVTEIEKNSVYRLAVIIGSLITLISAVFC